MKYWTTRNSIEGVSEKTFSENQILEMHWVKWAGKFKQGVREGKQTGGNMTPDRCIVEWCRENNAVLDTVGWRKMKDHVS